MHGDVTTAPVGQDLAGEKSGTDVAFLPFYPVAGAGIVDLVWGFARRFAGHSDQYCLGFAQYGGHCLEHLVP